MKPERTPAISDIYSRFGVAECQTLSAGTDEPASKILPDRSIVDLQGQIRGEHVLKGGGTSLISDTLGAALIGPTRKSTQDLAEQHPAVKALRAEIVWGESETVVSDTKYDCDQVNPTRSTGKDHVTVCKPDTLASPAVRMVRDGKF